MNQYDDKGKLTRAAAVQIIQGGGSVLVNGQLYNTVDKLPGEAEFAKGDEKAETAAKARLQKTIKDAEAELSSMDKPSPAKEATAKSAHK